jgi:hypothetical protein
MAVWKADKIEDYHSKLFEFFDKDLRRFRPTVKYIIAFPLKHKSLNSSILNYPTNVEIIMAAIKRT